MKIAILLFLSVILNACASSEANFKDEMMPLHVLAVFAHPDDETWVSGTLAKMADKGIKVTAIYITSGDVGSRYSTIQKTGNSLAFIREQEARLASAHLTIEPPIFFNYPDKGIEKHAKDIASQLSKAINKQQASHLLSFAQGGITDNKDHKALHRIVKQLKFKEKLYFAISEQRARIFEKVANDHGFAYKIKRASPEHAITHHIDVSKHHKQRNQALQANASQFPNIMLKAFDSFTQQAGYEELIIEKLTGKTQNLLKRINP